MLPKRPKISLLKASRAISKKHKQIKAKKRPVAGIIWCCSWFISWKVDIDDAPVTKDIFIDDNLFRDTDIKDKDKQNIDDILQKVNHGDIRIAQTIVEIKEKSRLKPITTTTTTKRL